MPQKRANGEGSIRKRADGRWEARYVSPIDGKQRSVYGKTQKEVRQKLTQVMSEIDGGAYVDPSTMTVAQWMDTWLKDYCRDKNFIKMELCIFIFQHLIRNLYIMQ